MYLFKYLGILVLFVGALLLLLSAVMYFLMVSAIKVSPRDKLLRKLIHPALGALTDGVGLSEKGLLYRSKCYYFMRAGFLIGFVGCVLNIGINLVAEFLL